MITGKLAQLIAVCSVATFLSLSASPVQAMSLEPHSHLVARHAHINHDLTVKKKRASGKKCKNRSSPFTSKSSKSSKTTSSKATKPTAKTTTKNSNTGKSNSPGAYNGGKVCLAWPNGNDASLKNFKTDKVGPLYTWSPHIPTNAKKLGFKPVPMLWGAKQAADFDRLVVKGYADTILAYNEPNLDTQSGMSPSEGASLWKKHIEPKRALGYRLISPAPTSAPSGKKWLLDFLKACNGGCTLDAIALHWYGTNPDDMIAYIKDFHDTFKLPIWVTEFACQNFSGGSQASKDQIFNFMSKVTNFMDSADYVEAYCAFGVMHDMGNVNPANQLMNSAGQPTDLGWSYLT